MVCVTERREFSMTNYAYDLHTVHKWMLERKRWKTQQQQKLICFK